MKRNQRNAEALRKMTNRYRTCRRRTSKLMAENRRLREALEWIRDACEYEGEVIPGHGIPALHQHAERALKETDQ